MSIIPTLNTTLYNTLSGATNAGTLVFEGMAKDKCPLPYVVWSFINEHDENDNPHRMKNCAVFVRAYAASAAAAGAIDVQIDTALHNKVLTVAGWTNIQTRREDGHSLVEVDPAGVRTWMVGADYRIINGL
jgi:hypothetical protein